MTKKKQLLSICGPMKDGQFTVWMVRGPRGGCVAEFLSRKAARAFVKNKLKHHHHHKELITT